MYFVLMRIVFGLGYCGSGGFFIYYDLVVVVLYIFDGLFIVVYFE